MTSQQIERRRRASSNAPRVNAPTTDIADDVLIIPEQIARVIRRGRATNTPATNTPASSTPALHSDVLWGARAISDYINRPLRTTFHLLQAGRLDADKVGNIWQSTRSRLDRQFQSSRRASS